MVNLPKSEYIRSASDTEISVQILPHESVYGTMHLSLSAYYSRVYRLRKCSHDDLASLKIAFSRALGAYPIMAGRCRRQGPNSDPHISVVLPTECLVSNENSSVSAIGCPDNRPQDCKVYGVPFRVYRLSKTDVDDIPPLDQPLNAMDAAKYSVYENPVDVMKGNGAICTVCVYLCPDGSATLSLTVSHAVMDGVSISSFEKTWAEESRKLFEMDPPSESCDPTAWYPHHEPLTTVAPVQREGIAGPFEDMQDFRDAQKEFFGKVLDDGPTIDGTRWQKFVGWLCIEVLLPYIRFYDDLMYLWGVHPDQHRNVVTISKEKIKSLKEEATPPEPDWIASQDAVVAVLVKRLVEVRKKKGKYRKKRVRLVMFRDARPFLEINPNHCYGLGVLNWPITIDDPDKLSLSEVAVQIRKGLLEMHTDEKARRFWRLITTVFEKRRWAFLTLVHQGLYDEKNSDDRLMLNNSIFPLPNFGGEIGEALSLTTQAGPSLLLPEADGGCRLMIEKELSNILTEKLLCEAFQQ